MIKPSSIPSSYSETVEFLFEQLPMFQRVGDVAIKKDLTNIRLLCDALDNPQDKIRCIHVAGTNGKGSVTHALAAMLQTTYKRVGIYTSPHLRDYRERIKIGDQYISKKGVVQFVTENLDLIQSISPSFFEITVAMSFWWFEKMKVDIAVIETGLGGRLDSTNIITPILSVITNISLDHQQFLGDTLEEIAGEKAGIIKPGVPVVVGRKDITSRVFEQVAKQRKADLTFSQDIVNITIKAKDQPGTWAYHVDWGEDGKSFNSDLIGDFQTENLRTAISAMKILSGSVHELSMSQAVDALRDVKTKLKFRGRWQVLESKPLIIADGAHNIEAIMEVVRQINGIKYTRLHLVLAFVKEKNVKALLSLFPKDAIFYFTQAKIPRALPIDELGLIAHELGLEHKVYKNATTAVKKARSLASDTDLVFIGGSLYLLAEIL